MNDSFLLHCFHFIIVELFWYRYQYRKMAPNCWKCWYRYRWVHQSVYQSNTMWFISRILTKIYTGKSNLRVKRWRVKPDLCFCVSYIFAYAVPWPPPPQNATTHCSNAEHKYCDRSAWWTRISSYAFLASSSTLLLHTYSACMNTDEGKRDWQKPVKNMHLYDSSSPTLQRLPDGRKFVARHFHKHWGGRGNCRAMWTCGRRSMNVLNGVGHVCNLQRRLACSWCRSINQS